MFHVGPRLSWVISDITFEIHTNGMVFLHKVKNSLLMIIPFIALIVILTGIVLFMVLAGKKKVEGEDLGDSHAGANV